MRRYLAVLIFTLILLLSACSYTASFVILNESEKPLKVQYKIKNSPYEPLQLIGEPAKTAASNLRQSDRQWQMLKSGEYQLDREARTVTVEVPPHEALRVSYITNYGGHDGATAAGKFEIDEVVLSGSSGEIKFEGDQARRKFIEDSESLYVLSYR
jgi:hypothetical protein